MLICGDARVDTASVLGLDLGDAVVILLQHPQRGAVHFADLSLQKTMKEQIGADVSEHAITKQAEDLLRDLDRQRPDDAIASRS